MEPDVTERDRAKVGLGTDQPADVSRLPLAGAEASSRSVTPEENPALRAQRAYFERYPTKEMREARAEFMREEAEEERFKRADEKRESWQSEIE